MPILYYNVCQGVGAGFKPAQMQWRQSGTRGHAGSLDLYMNQLRELAKTYGKLNILDATEGPTIREFTLF